MWGLLGPEFLPSTRRIRTLDLGASVRHFNELAVPGLGGIWFGKQVLLATLGVLVAEQARRNGKKVHNIEVTNAIEALACWLAFKNNGWRGDPRLRGNTKLWGISDDFSFARARQRNFYVTQPMRMATVQALPALGFVQSESTRFNAFRTSDIGESFIKEALKDFNHYKLSVLEHLTMWVCGKDTRFCLDKLQEALSPLKSLNINARQLLRERLIQGGHEDLEAKRRSALEWVDALWSTKSAQQDWKKKPEQIAENHWGDLMAGARFFNARESAIRVLDTLEAHIGNQASGAKYSLQASVPDVLKQRLEDLRNSAEAFLGTRHSDGVANSFCRECAKEDSSQVLKSLVMRDGHVLRLIGNDVKPGPAFRGSETAGEEQDTELTDYPARGSTPLPDDISYRMHNLYLLNVDLHGQLSPASQR